MHPTLRSPLVLAALCAVGLACLAPAPSRAQGPAASPATSPAAPQEMAPAPAAPVRIIVPLPPGTALDGVARRLANRAGLAWKQPVIVENRPGASGILAADMVARAPGDGLTLSITTASTVAIAPHTFRKLPHDPLRDFKPVIRIGTTPLVLVVKADNPAASLQAFLDDARKRPGKVSFGSFGNGTSAHLMGEELGRKANVQLVHVPYKSVSATDVAAGVIDSAITDFGSVRTYLSPPAKLRALALTGAGRNAEYPDIPTFGELGYPSLTPMIGWQGIFVPSATPDPVVARLAKDLGEALDSAEIRETLRAFGYEPSGVTGAPLRAAIENDSRVWGAIAREVGVVLD